MIRVRQIKVLVENKSEYEILKRTAKKLKIDENSIKNIHIVKESIDARCKNEIYFVYEVDVEVENEEKILKKFNSNDILKAPNLEYIVNKTGKIKLEKQPVIVGSGPAGLFCALILAENGIKPIIIEQGSKVEKRIKDVDELLNNNKLNKLSNIQFGEGGAGTFSDGKLNTLIKDTNNRGRKVFKTFVECGADEDILYSYKPHIGTDVLRSVIINLRKKIEYLGGIFLFDTKLTNINIINDKIASIEVNNNKIIETDLLILAIGNSSRDTFRLLDKYLKLSSKPFAVGLRIMHPQELIDESQYGKKYKNILTKSTYKLTYQASDKRGVYTFCMCPGGYVINSSSEDNRLVINGMSYHNRNSGTANSAIVVTVTDKDFGGCALDGIIYQENLEEKCFNLGNGLIPVQTVKDFYNNELTTIENDNLCIKGKYKFANLNELLPTYISNDIKEALINMDKKIVGFKSDDAILAAIETRTSSPIRIERNELFESSIKGVYPIGEGAGYAGGITSSAIDGIKCAESILSIYK